MGGEPVSSFVVARVGLGFDLFYLCKKNIVFKVFFDPPVLVFVFGRHCSFNGVVEGLTLGCAGDLEKEYHWALRCLKQMRIRA